MKYYKKSLQKIEEMLQAREKGTYILIEITQEKHNHRIYGKITTSIFESPLHT